MTVSSQTSRIEQLGDGTTTAFAVNFYFLENSDLKVFVNGVLQTITTNYTVTGAGNPAGGAVTFVSAPANGVQVVIFRDPALTQGLDYIDNDPFPAESHERGLDKLTMIAQRVKDLVSRALRLGDSVVGVNTELPALSGSQLLGTKPDGSGFQLYPLGSTPNTAANIVYTPAGTGGVATTAENQFNKWVFVDNYGGDPTGVEDSRQAILDALAVSNRIIFTAAGNYVSSASIVTTDQDIEIEGQGATLTFTTGNLSFSGSISAAFTLSANVDLGDNVITVSGGDFSAGDVMQMVDTTPFSYSLHRDYYYTGQLFTVKEAAGNVLTTYENSYADWVTGANIEVKKISPIKVRIKNLTVLAPDTVNSNYAAQITYAKDVLLEGSTFFGGDIAGLTLADVKGAKLDACTCICDAPLSGLQYGLSIDDCEDVLIDGSNLYGTRHATGFGGSGATGTKSVTVRKSVLAGDQNATAYVADIHGNCAYITYDNNTIFGGAVIAGEDCIYINNTIFANNNPIGVDPIFSLNEIVKGDFTIQNNKCFFPDDNTCTNTIGATAVAVFATINANYHIRVKDNKFFLNANQTSGINLGTHYLAPTVQPSVTWENNKFDGDCSGLARVIRLAGVRDPGTLLYVDATGPFYVLDFDPTSTMGAVVPFGVTAGTIAATAKFLLPDVIGSNANGSFTKFADGTMICRFAYSVASTAINAAYVGGFRSTGLIWTFPETFIAAPVVSATPASLNCFSCVSNGVTTSTLSFVFTAVASQAAATLQANLIAVGRWY